MSERKKSTPGGVAEYLTPAWLQTFALSAEENELCLRAAARAGIDVKHWARQTLVFAADKLLQDG